jgi:small conductance mechanosensitive channel
MLEELKPVMGQLANYGEIIASILFIMFGGMVAVIALYKVATAFIRPGGAYARAMKVFFGAVYAMVLVITVLVAAARIGLPVEGLAGPAILIVIVVAVIIFFLVPFLPRLPFVTGDMVKIKDVMGVVEAITAYQVVVRTFDGQTVFMPTAVVMSSAIRNYTAIPNRRIEMNLDIYASDDIERARALLLETMELNAKVLADPAPTVFVTGITGESASLLALCWVENADWFGTRDALWVAVAAAFADDDKVSMALPQMQVSGSP